MLSTASVTALDTGKTVRFAGVTSIRIAQSLRIATGSDAETATDLINGARNQPTKITLSVVESDVTGGNRSRSILAFLTALRTGRRLCRVHTALADYDSLLLTDCAVVRDEANPCGWTATLTFTETTADASGDPAAPEGNAGLPGGLSDGLSSNAGGSAFGAGRQVGSEEIRSLFAAAGIRFS